MTDHRVLVLLCAVAASGLGAWILFGKILPAVRAMRAYIRQVCVCGYLPPPPTPKALRWWRRFAKLMLWVQVGKVRVIDRHYATPPGPHVITPNHGSSADPLVFAKCFDEPLRYMAAGGVFEFMRGLSALVAGPCGAFYTDLRPGKGWPAREAAVRVLTSRQTLVMFPEGWAYMDGKMGPFRKGAVRIAREASTKLGEATYIVPCYMRYGRYPGSWIRRFSPPVEYLLVMLLWPIYRRGVTIAFGKPIRSDELPADDAAAIDMLEQAIVSLDPQASKARS